MIVHFMVCDLQVCFFLLSVIWQVFTYDLYDHDDERWFRKGVRTMVPSQIVYNTSERLLAQISLWKLFCAVGTMDCLGLALTWEKDCELRARLRDSSGLMVCPDGAKFCEPTRSNAIDNLCVLKPLLQRMSKTQNWSLPHLDPLQRELSLLFNKAGKSASEGVIYKAANEIKKLAGFVKRRVRRKEVTKERGNESVLFRISSCYFIWTNYNYFLMLGMYLIS